MKKSQLRKIIRESIKQLMTEQNPTGTLVSFARTCTGGATVASYCWEGNIQVGDVMEVTGINGNGFQSYVGRSFFAKQVGGSCNNIKFLNNINQTDCPKCCNGIHGWGGAGNNNPSGTCTFNCAPTSAGTCNPAAWPNSPGYNNWTNSFTNTVNNMNPNNPNQPCQFLCGKETQFITSLSGGGGGGAANLWQCKLEVVQSLMATHNCANSNASNC